MRERVALGGLELKLHAVAPGGPPEGHCEWGNCLLGFRRIITRHSGASFVYDKHGRRGVIHDGFSLLKPIVKKREELSNGSICIARGDKGSGQPYAGSRNHVDGNLADRSKRISVNVVAGS